VKPVAIAAVGVVCGLGRDAASVSSALARGGCGVRPITAWPASALPTGVAACVQGSVAEVGGFPDDRKVALLMEAVRQVLEDPDTAVPERRGVFLGTGLSSITPRELAEDVYPHLRDGRVDRDLATVDVDASRVAPGRHLPARATALVARRWGATGPGGTSFSACAAAAEAIAAGARAIARGEADVVIAGGHDAMIHPLGLLSFQALGALAAEHARPFDADRDGFVLGEGAAVLRLEAVERCQHPLGYLVGAGSSLDASGVTAPHPEGAGAEAAMRRALRDAGLTAADVSWVNAHATGTPVGDHAEALAILRLLGRRVPVSGLKGALGHTLAAAGAIEAVATVLAWHGGFTPGTVGCRAVDPLIEIGVLRETVARPPGIVLSNSFGFGGQNVCLVMAPP
jgi:3-oxoacyl-[acyl-carrier-protein] synthase II